MESESYSLSPMHIPSSSSFIEKRHLELLVDQVVVDFLEIVVFGIIIVDIVLILFMREIVAPRQERERTEVKPRLSTTLVVFLKVPQPAKLPPLQHDSSEPSPPAYLA